MKKKQKPKKKEKTDPLSAEEMLKNFIQKKENETEALKKIIDSLEKKLKPKI